MAKPIIDPASSSIVSDEIKTTTCYMCACRCGIKVHLQNGEIRYIEGNPDHPVNGGVICAKGASGIMQHQSPARLTKPLKRIGERGEGTFEEIEWDEALDIAAGWLGDIRKSDPKKLAFFTGRDQSQSFTGWWAQQFGTPNHAAHGGFCSVNMAAAGLYTIGGSFWEFGEPDWEHTKYLLMFGIAEDHDSNPIKIGLGKLKSRSDTKFVSVNPVRSGYSAIADEWVGIKPGTDGLFIFSLIYELLRAEKVDFKYLARYTNAPWLVIQDPGGDKHGLFYRHPETDKPVCFDDKTGELIKHDAGDISPRLVGEFSGPNGETLVPSFQLCLERFFDEQYAPANVAEKTGVSAEQIERIAAELAEVAFEQEIVIEQRWTDWTGKQHDKFIGRPVSMHAMRGISAHSNGFHTCRALHVLQLLLGTIDVPGGFRYKPPFPKHVPPGQKPARASGEANAPLSGLPLGFPSAPEDLLVEADGSPHRIDKAFSWEHPLALHGMMHMVIHNCWAGDPYPIDTLFLYMANMAWNSSMNIPETLRYLTDKDSATGKYKIPHIIYSDAYCSETIAYADLVLPDTTYLERWDCISLLDRPIGDADGAADAIRQPVVAPDRDVRPFQDALLELGVRLGLGGMVDEAGAAKYPGGYSDYIQNHMRNDKVGPLAGFRGQNGAPPLTGASEPNQLDKYIANGCYFRHELEPEQRYYKFANWDYLTFANDAGWIGNAEPIVMQIYSEPLQKLRLAGAGKGANIPPEELRERISTYCDPIPFWYEPTVPEIDAEQFPLHAITQRPMHMYHSWGSQNAWLRQITNTNVLYVHSKTARKLGLDDGDWVKVKSADGEIKAPIQISDATNPDTVWTWNAIGKRKGAWGLSTDAPESQQGFLLNHLIGDLLPARKDGYRYSNADPVTGQAAWFDLKVSIEKCAHPTQQQSAPQFNAAQVDLRFAGRGEPLQFGKSFDRKLTGEPTSDIHERVPHSIDSLDDK
ncbi:MAG: molybdopterin oxidoreductase family protein [Gammaproteobacteria bacterium]